MSTEPIKIPFSNATIGQRGASNSVDAKLINVYLEKDPAGHYWAVKRPGTTNYATNPSPLINTAYGAFYWAGHNYSVSNGHLWQDGVTDLGAVDVSAGTKYWFDATLGGTPRLFLHNTTKAYYYDAGGGLQLAAAANALQPFTAGTAYLDGTMYIGAGTNSIYGSGINDLTVWNALNVINTQMVSDTLLAVFRQLSYVIGLGSQSVQAFIDAGNASGSPLAPAQGSFLPFGCISANTLAIIEDTALWVATNSNGGLSVMSLENMRPSVVSTPPVERILASAGATTWGALSYRSAGHKFYLLQINSISVTLVYDLTMKEWSYWQDASGSEYPYYFSTTNALGQTILQDSSGNLNLLDGTVNLDFLNGATQAIPVTMVTPNWDGGTRVSKTAQRLTAIADQYVTGNLRIRWSEDDYQTWSDPIYLELNSSRPEAFNLGTFNKRAWELFYSENTPFRLSELDLVAMLGTI